MGHESRNLFLDGPAGRLEAILWKPLPGQSEGPDSAVHSGGSTPLLAGLVCHPHPLFGGTMHNKVVYQVAKTLDHLGVAVLRFNFRGAGLSAGMHDRGKGEQADAQAGLDFLSTEFPRTPLLLAGFSFGAWVGLRAGCEDKGVTELIALGTPVNNSDFSYLASCGKPKLFVHGAKDEYGDVKKVEHLVESLPGENRLIVIDGAEHFFMGKLDQVDRAISDWLRERHSETEQVSKR